MMLRGGGQWPLTLSCRMLARSGWPPRYLCSRWTGEFCAALSPPVTVRVWSPCAPQRLVYGSDRSCLRDTRIPVPYGETERGRTGSATLYSIRVSKVRGSYLPPAPDLDVRRYRHPDYDATASLFPRGNEKGRRSSLLFGRFTPSVKTYVINSFKCQQVLKWRARALHRIRNDPIICDIG